MLQLFALVNRFEHHAVAGAAWCLLLLGLLPLALLLTLFDGTRQIPIDLRVLGNPGKRVRE